MQAASEQVTREPLHFAHFHKSAKQNGSALVQAAPERITLEPWIFANFHEAAKQDGSTFAQAPEQVTQFCPCSRIREADWISVCAGGARPVHT